MMFREVALQPQGHRGLDRDGEQHRAAHDSVDRLEPFLEVGDEEHREELREAAEEGEHRELRHPPQQDGPLSAVEPRRLRQGPREVDGQEQRPLEVALKARVQPFLEREPPHDDGKDEAEEPVVVQGHGEGQFGVVQL
ncbi:hypothetical protein THAOC_18905 [Thalassiosira oceanica]|uniref:Uncharacterized protein n=1 Tax=Thalassiosira oceanica TaxID=159749 RepID=K0S658_THAOC|nr:hypothetical protein THAOC_18905 [Thalassiosira oceanica]|eukprot:EJK60695.1 hypothetical protein THAOC_18905 [Thalassiosira oceanica]